MLGQKSPDENEQETFFSQILDYQSQCLELT